MGCNTSQEIPSYSGQKTTDSAAALGELLEGDIEEATPINPPTAATEQPLTARFEAVEPLAFWSLIDFCLQFLMHFLEYFHVPSGSALDRPRSNGRFARWIDSEEKSPGPPKVFDFKGILFNLPDPTLGN
uniref:Uncharacterized protein n=1 Tax=Anopheles atroparvus TaxID=41427 RepID=A0A182J006_ANOAO